jgi:two-component system, NtrC family, response regulator PilR
LQAQRYEGNVRELENLLHRAVALSAGGTIEAADLGIADPDAGGADPMAEATSIAVAGPQASRRERALAGSDGAASSVDSLPSDLVAHLDAVERDVLQRALEMHRFNRTAAGASLGLSLRQMRYRMARLGITAPGDAASGE